MNVFCLSIFLCWFDALIQKKRLDFDLIGFILGLMAYIKINREEGGE